MSLQRTRIKICGLTRPENAVAVEACGIDAVGLVFYPPSKRFVEPAVAAEIASSLGPLVHKVGLFVDAEPSRVEQILNTVDLTLLQFHGDETAQYCESFGRPYIKAIRMQPGVNAVELMQQHPRASGFLLDAYRAGVPGGTGESFDWKRVPRQPLKSLILAGGLGPNNIKQALQACRVYGIDLSGGVESAPGVKDIDKVKALVAAVRECDQQ